MILPRIVVGLVNCVHIQYLSHNPRRLAIVGSIHRAGNYTSMMVNEGEKGRLPLCPHAPSSRCNIPNPTPQT